MRANNLPKDTQQEGHEQVPSLVQGPELPREEEVEEGEAAVRAPTRPGVLHPAPPLPSPGGLGQEGHQTLAMKTLRARFKKTEVSEAPDAQQPPNKGSCLPGLGRRRGETLHPCPGPSSE